MRCLETALGLALLALGATAWSPSCKPCRCILSTIGWTIGLRTALCNNTALTSVPKFPVDTQHIWIQGESNISSLQGGEFDGYTNLTRIYLQHNPLTGLPSGIFSKTINVTEISLDYNKIKILQSHVFSNLLYLKKVWISENQISVLEDNCFFNVPQLSMIDLHSNRLRKINQNFINDYRSLENLYFDNNPVHCDDSICELTNRVVQRKLYEVEKVKFMPMCAGPPSVQNRTWAEAVEALWGAGPERCPAEPRGPGSAGPPKPTREVEAHMKDAGLQLLVAEMNRTRMELQQVKQELKDEVAVLLKEELNKSRNELRRVLQEQEKLTGAVAELERETQTYRHDQEAASTLFTAEMEKTRSEVGDGVRLAQEAFKAEMNETRSELRRVKEEVLAVKTRLDVFLEQVKQALPGKEAANILFKEVYQRGSGAQGVLLLRYSVLPGPDTTQPPT